MVAGSIGVHHEDQIMIFKDRDWKSNTYLHVAGVKNGSQILVFKDLGKTHSLEMQINDKFEEPYKDQISEISAEVEEFAKQVKFQLFCSINYFINSLGSK